MQVPETLIGTALGTALLPTLSEQIVRAETEAYRRTLNHALRVILALTVPGRGLIGHRFAPIHRPAGLRRSRR